MATMAALRGRVRLRLEEATAAVWSDAELDEGITGALEAYGWIFPREVLAAVAVNDGDTTVAVPAGALDVVRVVLENGAVVPKRGAPAGRTADEDLAWEVFAGSLRFSRGLSAQTITLWHTAAQTLDDLPPADEGLLVLGGVVQALEARAVQEFKRGGPLGGAGYDAVITRARAEFEREMDRRRRKVRATLVHAP